jgi:hypothetical protein
MAVALRTALRGAVPADSPPELSDIAARATALAAQLDTVAGLDNQRRFFGGPPAAPSFRGINGALVGQLNAQDLGDLGPTPGALAAYAATCRELKATIASWERLSKAELQGFNTMLKARGRTVLATPAGTLKVPNCGN